MVSFAQQRPIDFYSNSQVHEAWESIQVPGNWQMQGFGVPNYLNFGYPFPKEEFKVPEDWNPVGSYIRSFDVPETWNSQVSNDIYLRFEGVDCAFNVWINGKFHYN